MNAASQSHQLNDQKRLEQGNLFPLCNGMLSATYVVLGRMDAMVINAVFCDPI
jgi:hypothetical protein